MARKITDEEVLLTIPKVEAVLSTLDSNSFTRTVRCAFTFDLEALKALTLAYLQVRSRYSNKRPDEDTDYFNNCKIIVLACGAVRSKMSGEFHTDPSTVLGAHCGWFDHFASEYEGYSNKGIWKKTWGLFRRNVMDKYKSFFRPKTNSDGDQLYLVGSYNDQTVPFSVYEPTEAGKTLVASISLPVNGIEYQGLQMTKKQYTEVYQSQRLPEEPENIYQVTDPKCHQRVIAIVAREDPQSLGLDETPREYQNSVQLWAARHTQAGGFTKPVDLYHSYEDYCNDRGVEALDRSQWVTLFESITHLKTSVTKQTGTRKSMRGYRGISIK